MKIITKKLLTLTLVSLPFGWVQPADCPAPNERTIVDAANARVESTNAPSRLCLATDPRALGQMADQIMARNGIVGNVIHDNDVKSFLLANDLDLEEVWEEQFPQDQPDGIMQSIASILGFGSTERNQGIDPVKTALLESNFNDELRAYLAGRLTTIRELVHTALQNPAPLENNPLSVLFTQGDKDLQDKLTSALLEYFKLDNILARAAKGDGYILDLPSTPLMVISGNVHRVLSFARLKQEVKDYESAEKKINRFRNELFNNHRYDDSDPYWLEETTKQRKKLYSRVYLGLMALGWCSSAMAYKLYYDMTKARSLKKKLVSSQEVLTQVVAENNPGTLPTLFDNRADQNPKNYQQNEKDCWAFAGRRLVEEQLNRWYKENGEESKYVSMNFFDLLDKIPYYDYCLEDKEGSTRHFLSYAINYGVCKEADGVAYFNHEEAEIFNTHLHDMAQNSTNAKPVNDVLFFPRQGTVKINTLLTEAIRSAADSFPYKNTLKETVIELVESQPEARKGFLSTLITEECQANRITEPFQDLQVRTQSLIKNYLLKDGEDSNLPIDEKIQHINEAIESGNSVALYVCIWDFFVPGSGGLEFHIVVLDAVRYSDESGAYEGHVRNSWGDSPYLSGWENYDRLLKHTRYIEYFKGKPNWIYRIFHGKPKAILKPQGQFAAEDSTLELAHKKAPSAYKSAQTHAFSSTSQTRSPKPKEEKTAPAALADTSHTQEGPSACPVKTKLNFEDLRQKECPKTLEFEFLDSENLSPASDMKRYTNVGGLYEDQI